MPGGFEHFLFGQPEREAIVVMLDQEADELFVCAERD